jgi:hypothetical protein
MIVPVMEQIECSILVCVELRACSGTFGDGDSNLARIAQISETSICRRKCAYNAVNTGSQIVLEFVYSHV